MPAIGQQAGETDGLGLRRDVVQQGAIGESAVELQRIACHGWQA
jgi:hypothetical protein